MALREDPLPDELWKRIEPHLPEMPKSPKGGRPWSEMRSVIAGIVWVLRTGARWKDLPDEFPSPSTCWRRLRLFERLGVWKKLWHEALARLDPPLRTGRDESYADGTFRAAKKGGTAIGKTKRGKGNKLMMAVNSVGVPVAALLAPANPGEATLIEDTLRQAPNGMEDFDIVVYDKAADSDMLRDSLADQGVELVCPHRSNRVRPARQDGRALRRYRRRYIVERAFAWLDNFRRLVARYEWYDEMYVAFVHIACAMIAIRRL